MPALGLAVLISSLARGLALFVGHALPTFASFCRACLLSLSVFLACCLTILVRHVFPAFAVRVSSFRPYLLPLLASCLTFLVSHILVRFASLFVHSFTLLGRHVSWICGRRLLSQGTRGH